jgi:hypothetical protein
MLGEQIGHETGQITGMRVLPAGDGGVKVEVSFQASGTLLGVQENNMGTYVSVRQPDGSLRGEGQGVVRTDDGEMAIWRGQGVGHFTGQGRGVSWRGAVYYETQSQRLSRLNDLVGVFEYETEADGKAENNTFEWK